MVQHVLVNDCGGHGRALEMMVDVFDDYPASIGPNVKFMVAGKLKTLYGRNVVPENEEDQVAIIKAVLTNQRLSRYQCIPATNLTPDTICQSGLIGFEGVEPGASVGYLRVPYIWVLTLCMLHSNPLVDELQLFDYQDFWAKYNPTMPGQFSWSDFEKLMVKIRKLKSHVFHDGAEITVGDMHAGGVMTLETKNIRFVNHHLKDDLAKHRTGTKTKSSNKNTWMVESPCYGDVQLREHQYILLNAAGASAGDAVLSIDSDPPRTESHQYKKVQTDNVVDLRRERAKAAGANDIFCLFSTSKVGLPPQGAVTGKRRC